MVLFYRRNLIDPIIYPVIVAITPWPPQPLTNPQNYVSMEREKGVVPKAVAAMNCVNTAESNIHVRSVRGLDYVVMIRCPLNVKTVMGRDFVNMENGSLIVHYVMVLDYVVTVS